METFENGARLEICRNSNCKEYSIFEGYAFDFSDMMPIANLDEAVKAKASIPDSFFKIKEISQSSVVLEYFSHKNKKGEEKVLKLSGINSCLMGEYTITLKGIRYNASSFDDWKTS